MSSIGNDSSASGDDLSAMEDNSSIKKDVILKEQKVFDEMIETKGELIDEEYSV